MNFLLVLLSALTVLSVVAGYVNKTTTNKRRDGRRRNRNSLKRKQLIPHEVWLEIYESY